MSRFDDIQAMRQAGYTWAQIGPELGISPEAARSMHRRGGTRKRPLDEAVTDIAEGHSRQENFALDDVDLRTIRTLEDLVAALEVDAEWAVRSFRGSAWEQSTSEGGTRTLFSVKAEFERNKIQQYADAEAALRELIADAKAHAPVSYDPVPRVPISPASDPVLFTVAIMDPHFGMLAWGKETGQSYDIDIAIKDYRRSLEALLPLARLYPTARILYVAGNDGLHTDTAAEAGKGGRTTAGTMQDTDGRNAKMFTAYRRALVEGIDMARCLAPVDVVFVPGNHDREQTYRMGEVVSAWYRNDPEVNVIYGPQKRFYYGFGKTALMLTHGEEYARQRDNLPLIFASECPADLWALSTHREVLTGHNHRLLAGRYLPTFDATEQRGIRTRSLPALTATDAWHKESGYMHTRASTALAYRHSGGFAGLNEFPL